MSEALLIVTPFEVVKTRLQQQKGTDKALLKYRVRTAQWLGGWVGRGLAMSKHPVVLLGVLRQRGWMHVAPACLLLVLACLPAPHHFLALPALPDPSTPPLPPTGRAPSTPP